MLETSGSAVTLSRAWPEFTTSPVGVPEGPPLAVVGLLEIVAFDNVVAT